MKHIKQMGVKPPLLFFRRPADGFSGLLLSAALTAGFSLAGAGGVEDARMSGGGSAAGASAGGGGGGGDFFLKKLNID